jgi:type VI protein secretion system component Hcp
MASFNYFLSVAGVTGGSHDAHHAGEFDALGYEFDLAAVVAASSGGGGGAGTTKFAPLIVDLATTPGLVDLLTRETSGQHIPSVTFTVQTTGGTPFDFETITLTNVTIVSYEEKAGFATRVALAYDKVEVVQTNRAQTALRAQPTRSASISRRTEPRLFRRLRARSRRACRRAGASTISWTSPALTAAR